MVCRIIRTLLAVVAAGAAEAFLSPTVLARTFASADRHGACRRRPPRASVVLAQAGSDSDSDSSGLYAALRQRRSQLAARRSATQQERALVATLGETYQVSPQDATVTTTYMCMSTPYVHVYSLHVYSLLSSTRTRAHTHAHSLDTLVHVRYPGAGYHGHHKCSASRGAGRARPMGPLVW